VLFPPFFSLFAFRGWLTLHLAGLQLLNNRYRVVGFTGEGVFSRVVRAQDLQENNIPVAIKMIRNNEFMAKTALKEAQILELVNRNDPHHKFHCVRVLDGGLVCYLGIYYLLAGSVFSPLHAQESFLPRFRKPAVRRLCVFQLFAT
jgi:serine/threonine protein kinase